MKRSVLAAGPPYVLGVTGGIGTGKTTLVRAWVEEFEPPLIEADRLGHEALLPGSTVYESLVARFGDEVVRTDGSIDRGRLAQIVFRDEAALIDLNGLVHPWILERIEARVEALKASGYAGIILLDAALLLEWIHRYRPHGVVVVTAPLADRLERLEKRGMSREESERRISHQRPESEWTSEADWVVENTGSLEDLANTARSLWARIRSHWKLGRTPQPGGGNAS
ncbi:MAG: dephospho-CoA kinase [Candidatus Eisenbacteria bacterium]